MASVKGKAPAGLQKSASMPGLGASSAHSAGALKMGSSVRITGMRHRPELNGIDGEIVHEQADEHGRVYVKLKRAPQCKVMRISKANLKDPTFEPRKQLDLAPRPGPPPADIDDVGYVQALRRGHVDPNPDPLKAFRPSACHLLPMLGHPQDRPPGPGEPGAGKNRVSAETEAEQCFAASTRSRYEAPHMAPRRTFARKPMGGFYID